MAGRNATWNPERWLSQRQPGDVPPPALTLGESQHAGRAACHRRPCLDRSRQGQTNRVRCGHLQGLPAVCSGLKGGASCSSQSKTTSRCDRIQSPLRGLPTQCQGPPLRHSPERELNANHRHLEGAQTPELGGSAHRHRNGGPEHPKGVPRAHNS